MHDVSDEWVVDLVDKWKAEYPGVGNASPIAQLLYLHAPADIRRRLDQRRAVLENRALTNYRVNRAPEDAVRDIEGDRLSWWVKRLDRARRSLRGRRYIHGPRSERDRFDGQRAPERQPCSLNVESDATRNRYRGVVVLIERAETTREAPDTGTRDAA